MGAAGPRAYCARCIASSSSKTTSVTRIRGIRSPLPEWWTCALDAWQTGQWPSATGPAQEAQIRCSQLILVPSIPAGARVTSPMLDVPDQFPP